jgi:outer membrane protein insertion porin family
MVPLQHVRVVSRFLVLCLFMLAPVACSTKASKVPTVDALTAFPEVRRITFVGNDHFKSSDLRKAMATKQRPLFPPWKRGEPYNPPTLEADLRRLKKFYFDRGFLDTAVRIGEVQEDTEKHLVQIKILIAEGPPTLVDAVHLAGTLPPELPSAQTLLADLPLQPRQRITKVAFDQSKERLLKRLQDVGCARAQIVPRTEVDTQAHTADITFTVEPSLRTTFGQLSISGNKKVRERAIRRQLRISEGQTYSAKALTESTDAIFNLGMFQAVTPRERNPEQVDEPLDIDIEVRERKARQLRLGFGVSSVDRFRLLAQWTHRNLFGGAQQLRVTMKFASYNQELEGQLHFPYFLNRRMQLTQTAFVRNEQDISTDPLGLTDILFNVKDPQPGYDLLRVGGETRVGYQLTRVWDGFAGLELSLNDFRNVDPAIVADAGEGAVEDNVLLIQFIELRRNTRNNLLNPTRGMLLRGRFDHSTQAIISDASFIKLVLEARHYQPLWGRVILATRLLVGRVVYAGLP